jgi:hypothetical protein
LQRKASLHSDRVGAYAITPGGHLRPATVASVLA